MPRRPPARLQLSIASHTGLTVGGRAAAACWPHLLGARWGGGAARADPSRSSIYKVLSRITRSVPKRPAVEGAHVQARCCAVRPLRSKSSKPAEGQTWMLLKCVPPPGGCNIAPPARRTPQLPLPTGLTFHGQTARRARCSSPHQPRLLVPLLGALDLVYDLWQGEKVGSERWLPLAGVSLFNSLSKETQPPPAHLQADRIPARKNQHGAPTTPAQGQRGRSAREKPRHPLAASRLLYTGQQPPTPTLSDKCSAVLQGPTHLLLWGHNAIDDAILQSVLRLHVQRALHVLRQRGRAGAGAGREQEGVGPGVGKEVQHEMI